MIPIGQEREKTQSQMFSAEIFCIIGWVTIVLLLATLLYGCEIGAPVLASNPDAIEARLKEVESVLAQEADIRLAALKKVDEQLAIGALVAQHNAGLSIGEAYLIGRAIDVNADRHGLDPLLLAAMVVVESHGEAHAVSPKGAVGVMQVMPYWMNELGVEGNLFDIETNVNVGAFILADNIRRWGRDEGLRRYVAGNGPGGRIYVRQVKAVQTAMQRQETM